MGCAKIYIEIKQLDRNKEDKKVIKNLREGKDTAWWERTDKRIRSAIDSARRQFREYKTDNKPNLLVVYDNTSLGIIDPIEIKTAMYGDELVTLSIQDNAQKPNIIPIKFGFGGDLTP